MKVKGKSQGSEGSIAQTNVTEFKLTNLEFSWFKPTKEAINSYLDDVFQSNIWSQPVQMLRSIQIIALQI